ncbi:hypothetical protein P7K49_010693 [Saguinus oedipus]|uniref:Protein Wnt n=1 Tax=Saguinus oedipus TaxID=9490 RepID=A0ABQ9VRV1_SAGOE|nr:hypothetical protein P7K49_010693 [Saguinus oedipus]
MRVMRRIERPSGPRRTGKAQRGCQRRSQANPRPAPTAPRVPGAGNPAQPGPGRRRRRERPRAGRKRGAPALRAHPQPLSPRASRGLARPGSGLVSSAAGIPGPGALPGGDLGPRAAAVHGWPWQRRRGWNGLHTPRPPVGGSGTAPRQVAQEGVGASESGRGSYEGSRASFLQHLGHSPGEEAGALASRPARRFAAWARQRVTSGSGVLLLGEKTGLQVLQALASLVVHVHIYKMSQTFHVTTRESAFVHAIASAGVAFAVTRSCAEGTSTICGCDSHHKGPPGEGWKWGGCSEDADFGVLVSREFADARENRPDARSAMNKHNNEAGRTTILDHMHLKCKCHGLSGSCEVKTCWWAQPDFRAIGDFLKDKYDSASEMVVEKHRESRGWVETLRAKYSLFKPPTERDLVYYENSPNFCEPNPETGSFGTRDRTCNVTSHGIDGCDLLCCGRGHNTRTEKRKEKCHCIFHWCCYVSCQECVRVYDVHTCK